MNIVCLASLIELACLDSTQFIICYTIKEMDKNKNVKWMEKFIKDRGKLRVYSTIKIHYDVQRPYIYVKHPAILAAFAGYLKFQCQRNDPMSKVFCRGQVNDYPSIPSLLRGEDLTEQHLKSRLKAYCELTKKTKKLFRASRFDRENISPIFQHYGIKTPWLDLVDNIFVAIWFATKKFYQKKNGNKARYKTSKKKFGYIYFYSVIPGEYFDLREEHSSLSLRLHTQHGISITRKNGSTWSTNNRKLDDHLVATVKFPNTKEWMIGNEIFSTKFLFPSTDLDNTYKYLKKDKFAKLLQKIKNMYSLKEDELGSVTDFG